MALERLQEMARTVKRVLDRAREYALVRGIGYGIVVMLGFAAIVNLVVGVVAGLQGEWAAALGLILLGGGLVLACELIVDYLVDGEESGSTSP